MRLRDVLLTDGRGCCSDKPVACDPAGSHGARTDSIWRFSMERTRASACV
jgi:hypothetical protein